MQTNWIDSTNGGLSKVYPYQILHSVARMAIEQP